jgi:type IV pilus assembly protein PilC
MPKYRFRAVNTLGQVLKGHMGAANENHLAERLADMGYALLMFRAQQRVHWVRFWSREDNSQQQVLLFTQLAALAGAGVPLATCLEDTAVTMPDSKLRDTVRDIIQSLREGVDFVTACARHRHTFSPTVVALLQAGMAGGNPAQIFAPARDHVKWQAELGTLLRRALRYPLFLLMLTLGVMSFMLIGIVPQLIQFMSAQDIASPWQTRALIPAVAMFHVLWWALPLLLIGGGIAVVLLRRASSFVALTDGILLRIPGIGGIIGNTERAHFLHHLASMVTSGVPIIDALATAQTALTNRALQAQATRMLQSVAKGATLAEAFSAQRDFSGLAARREQIGLQGGDLAAQLLETSKKLDADAMARIKQFIAVLEPTLTLTVGLLLTWIVLAVLVPL